MDRRTACIAVAAAPWLATHARAQARSNARVAWVSVDRPNPASTGYLAFVRGMRELGWVEGKNLVVDTWWGEGSAAKLKDAVPKLVERRPDVVVAQGGLAANALVAANLPLPLVFTFSGDPVIARMVDSFARPGGNRTGITFFSLELVPKRLQILQEALPGIRRVAIVSSPLHAGERNELEAATRAATALGLAYNYHPATNPSELDAAFDMIQRQRADAILAFADALTQSFGERFAAFSARSRIPAMSGWSSFAEAGNLLSYGPVLSDSFARLATFVDRILKGTSPGSIPVEFPTKVELVVNRKTAQALGVSVTAAVLARADRVLD